MILDYRVFIRLDSKKTLPISKTLYPSYVLLFLFNNTTSYTIYSQDVFQVINIRKGFYVTSKKKLLVNG